MGVCLFLCGFRGRERAWFPGRDAVYVCEEQLLVCSGFADDGSADAEDYRPSARVADLR